MYQQFYGLRDIPFSLAPDPKYLFRTESLLEVFANLQYGIEHGKGIVVVTGEVGCGKTTILRSTLQSLDRSVLAAYIFNPILSTEEFFDLVAGEFKMRPQQSKSAMLRSLGHVLMSRHAQGLRTVLVIDEAHLLPPHLLEEIRLLLNFETNREKLIQIILCGQPELHDLLTQPELRQLKQRVSLKCSIKQLSSRETGEYIRWRLRVAGAKDAELFDPQAIRLVHQYSGGIPRIINNICDNALLTGFGQSSPRITASVISQVVEELDLTATEIVAAPTVAESVVEKSAIDMSTFEFQAVSDWQALMSESEPDAQASNVTYIRRERMEESRDNERFFIESSNRDQMETPLKFFSRVRVSRK